MRVKFKKFILQSSFKLIDAMFFFLKHIVFLAELHFAMLKHFIGIFKLSFEFLLFSAGFGTNMLELILQSDDFFFELIGRVLAEESELIIFPGEGDDSVIHDGDCMLFICKFFFEHGYLCFFALV